ncbi:family 10 glycosylhydrolase, partial [Paludibacteraceae bacterium OttesenSCG-928-F17]|nr:family 10 glycosylhydrolase [Paludibacteraceae bacterium OttesenSCG-928-F17]
VNMIIGELQATIKSVKPWVAFGISPFGVWRNGDVDPRGSATNAGIQNYDDLYADILKWLEEGTIDYVAPQLYWEIGKKSADYRVLAEWWSRHSFGKNLYIGLSVYKLGEKQQTKERSAQAWLTGNELTRQMRENQKHPEIDGVMFFSAKNFLANRQGLNDSLRTNYYKYPALCPVNKNIAGVYATQPENIRVIKDDHTSYLFWDKVEKQGGEKIAYYIVYAFKGKDAGNLNNPEYILARTRDNFLELKHPDGKKLEGNYTFVVTAVNRYKYESIPTHAVTRKI